MQVCVSGGGRTRAQPIVKAAAEKRTERPPAVDAPRSLGPTRRPSGRATCPHVATTTTDTNAFDGGAPQRARAHVTLSRPGSVLHRHHSAITSDDADDDAAADNVKSCYSAPATTVTFSHATATELCNNSRAPRLPPKNHKTLKNGGDDEWHHFRKRFFTTRNTGVPCPLISTDDYRTAVFVKRK